MNDDFFRQFDPGDAPPSADPLLSERMLEWKQLAAKRRRRIGWQRRALIAATCVIIAASIVPFNRPQRDASAPIAKQELPDRSPEPKIFPHRHRQAKREKVKPSELTLAIFLKELDHAGEVESFYWKQAVARLAASSASVQRESITLVSAIQDAQTKHRAMCLVGQAAGEDEKRLLSGWLDQPETRTEAWRRCLSIASHDDWMTLAQMAQSDHEKKLLCQQLWANPHSSSAEALTRLAAMARWRPAIRHTARPMSAEWTLGLVKQLRRRHPKSRIATVFVLASIPGQQLDRTLAEMVTQGRYRQPCYLTLMSRDTAVAKSFLAHAAQHQSLAPALVSARSHFNVIAPQLSDWKELSQGPIDESPANHTELFLPLHSTCFAITGDLDGAGSDHHGECSRNHHPGLST